VCAGSPGDRAPRALDHDKEEKDMAKAPRSLAGQVVAITGAARGIGRATAAALIAQGARVAIGDIDADLARQTASELGGGTIGLPLDVTERSSFEAFLDEVEARLGPLDVLINNAGIMPIGPFVEETDRTAERMVDINLHGVILGSKLALGRFGPRRRGHLVNVASIAGKVGVPHDVTYCATKFGVVGLTEALNIEYHGSGIEFSLVMPVGVNTELYSGLPKPRGMPIPEPSDVADAIVEALQRGIFDVYVPKRLAATVRLAALLPRRGAEALGRLFKGDEALINPDHAARAAYEARMNQTIYGQGAPPAAGGPSPANGDQPADPSQSAISAPI
jgi:NAD(P)-dependent dehydrogenase (short-subunit alcohol dehydrogenase family)